MVNPGHHGHSDPVFGRVCFAIGANAPGISTQDSFRQKDDLLCYTLNLGVQQRRSLLPGSLSADHRTCPSSAQLKPTPALDPRRVSLVSRLNATAPHVHWS